MAIPAIHNQPVEAKGRPSADTNMLAELDEYRNEITKNLDKQQRVILGQFFTPSRVARRMASMFDVSVMDEIKLLDPGAGIGILFATTVEAICAWPTKPRKIAVTAYEIEPTFIEYLERTAKRCEQLCNNHDIQFECTIRQEDFIISVAPSVGNSMLSSHVGEFTHAILNPPYHKINTDSHTRRLLEKCGIKATNLYTAFLGLASFLLSEQGQMVSITPRSFCNGVYFRQFRKTFLERMRIEKLHIFHSRTEAFKDDDVLQENIIMTSRKATVSATVIRISSSNGLEEHVDVMEVEPSQVVYPNDKDMIIHVITNEDDSNTARLYSRFTNTLDSLGIRVSTGQVVDFRAINYLVSSIHSEAVPLIYPAHFQNGYVAWPNPRARKPDGILESEYTRPLLIPSRYYVVVKRFSSKEEKRRIVAAVYDPNRIQADKVGFENHLNVFYGFQNELDANLAKGLAAFLNSTLVDSLFRLFSGHTQVNADDLRRLKYPTLSQLRTLGMDIAQEFPGQEALDEMVRLTLLT